MPFTFQAIEWQQPSSKVCVWLPAEAAVARNIRMLQLLPACMPESPLQLHTFAAAGVVVLLVAIGACTPGADIVCGPSSKASNAGARAG